MAKKSKEAPANAESTAPTTQAAPKGDQGANDRFTRVFADGKGATPTKDGQPKKIAPQLQVIANTLEAAGEAGLTRAELVKNLEGVITTRQPIGRIVTYYQKDIVAFGIATITK
jgi:hypothetical protein